MTQKQEKLNKVKEEIIQLVTDEDLNCMEALEVIKNAYYQVYEKANDLLSTLSTKQAMKAKRDVEIRKYGVDHEL